MTRGAVAARRGVGATAAGLAAPAAAFAHGLVGKQDLPIPRWLFAWAAASCWSRRSSGLAALWPTPRLQESRERRRSTVPPCCSSCSPARSASRSSSSCVYAGLAGDADGDRPT